LGDLTMNPALRVLIACEFSGTNRDAFLRSDGQPFTAQQTPVKPLC
jgi:hypothetical protein